MAAIWVPARMFRDWWPKAVALPKRSKSLKASPEKSWNPAGNTAIRFPRCSGARFGRSANTAFLFLSLKWDASQDFPTGKLPADQTRTKGRRYGYPEPRTSAYVSRKIAPHLPPRFRDVLCCNLDVVFFQQSLEAFQWFRRRAIFPQRFHEFQHRPLLVGRQLSQFFQHQLRNSHSRLRFYPTLFSALGKRQPRECSGGSSDPCCLPLLAVEAALAPPRAADLPSLKSQRPHPLKYQMPKGAPPNSKACPTREILLFFSMEASS